MALSNAFNPADYDPRHLTAEQVSGMSRRQVAKLATHWDMSAEEITSLYTERGLPIPEHAQPPSARTVKDKAVHAFTGDEKSANEGLLTEKQVAANKENERKARAREQAAKNKAREARSAERARQAEAQRLEEQARYDRIYGQRSTKETARQMNVEVEQERENARRAADAQRRAERIQRRAPHISKRGAVTSYGGSATFRGSEELTHYRTQARVKNQLDATIVQLSVLADTLHKPQGALLAAKKVFSKMEAERFANSGKSEEFETPEWQPLTSQTVKRKNDNLNARPGVRFSKTKNILIETGHLMEAAINPEFAFISDKTIDIRISVGRSRNGTDYGSEHQMGGIASNGKKLPRRPFVTLTPAFRAEAAAAVKEWIMSRTYAAANRSATPAMLGKQYPMPQLQEVQKRTRKVAQ